MREPGLRPHALAALGATVLVAVAVAIGGGAGPSGAEWPSESVAEGGRAVAAPDGHRVPVRFEAAGMPIELSALRVGDEREDSIPLEADLRYTGAPAVTAWQIRVETLHRDGGTTRLVRRVDWAAHGSPAILEPSVRSLEDGRNAEPSGPIEAGAVRTVDLGALSDTSAAVVVTVPLLVFDDASFRGDPRAARAVLESRAAGLDEVDCWVALLEDVLGRSESEAELAVALEEAIRSIESRELPAEPARRGARSARRSILDGLDALLAPNPVAPTRLRERLELELEWRRDELERRRPHVPAPLPR